jgi:hypothetical protein
MLFNTEDAESAEKGRKAKAFTADYMINTDDRSGFKPVWVWWRKKRADCLCVFEMSGCFGAKSQ